MQLQLCVLVEYLTVTELTHWSGLLFTIFHVYLQHHIASVSLLLFSDIFVVQP